jgi:hypothetical protein
MKEKWEKAMFSFYRNEKTILKNSIEKYKISPL